MRAAINLALRFQAVSHDPALAMRALRGQGVDRALETVEGHRAATLRHAERLVVVVTANITARHIALLSLGSLEMPMGAKQLVRQQVPVLHAKTMRR
jgi:hypothetical protein